MVDHESLLNAFRSENEPTALDRARVWRAMQRADARRRHRRIAATLLAIAAGIAALWVFPRWVDGPHATELSSSAAEQASFEQGAAKDLRHVEEHRAGSEPAAIAEPPKEQPPSVAVRAPASRRSALKSPHGPAVPTNERDVSPADAEVSLAVEIERLHEAERRIDAGEYEVALSLLEEHARRFPSSEFSLERKALRVIALCLQGNRAQGRGEAATLRRAAPGSPYLGRLENACLER